MWGLNPHDFINPKDLNTILGVRISTYELWRDPNIAPVAGIFNVILFSRSFQSKKQVMGGIEEKMKGR